MRWAAQGLLLGMLLGASNAYADCKHELDEVQEEAQKLELSNDFRTKLSQLRQSALLLAENDQEGLCDEVAESMKDMVNERRKVLAQEKRERALKTAPTITSYDRVIDLETLLDADVYDPEGDDLGTVHAVTVDAATGKVAYVVITYGGFLGFGEKLLPIPFTQLHMTEQRGMLVLDISRDLLDETPGIDPPPWPLHPPMPGQTGSASP